MTLYFEGSLQKRDDHLYLDNVRLALDPNFTTAFAHPVAMRTYDRDIERNCHTVVFEMPPGEIQVGDNVAKWRKMRLWLTPPVLALHNGGGASDGVLTCRVDNFVDAVQLSPSAVASLLADAPLTVRFAINAHAAERCDG